MTRYFNRLAALGISVILAACAADGTPLTPQTPETGSAIPGGGTVTQDKAGFNPFSTATAAPGGRDVIAHLTTADVMLASPLPEMSWGRVDAPVTVIKYASLTCPHCRKFQLDVWPHVKKEFVDTGKVRFIIREFPIGRASGTATVALRCAPSQHYLALYERYLSQQSSWVAQEVKSAEIVKIAGPFGVTPDKFDACLRDKALLDGLNWIKERGRKLGVIGTPNFIINNKLIKTTMSLEDFRAAVASAQSIAAR